MPSLTSKSELRMKFFELLFQDYEGYICIATTDPVAPKSTFRQRFYQWPDKSQVVENYILSVENRLNVYFCVNLLDKQERKKANCLPTDLVWADLDNVNPDDCEALGNFPAPIVIQSSPGRYQALWRLSTRVEPYLAEIYSKRLAYASGADISGWDLTQLLRVPFTNNFKYKPTSMVLLERALEIQISPLLLETLPRPADYEEDTSEFTQTVPKFEDLPDVDNILYKYSAILQRNGFAQDFTLEPGEGEDWSKVLWRLLHKMYDAGMEPEEAFVVANAAKCNKYARDDRPIDHLWRDVQKAHASHSKIVNIAGLYAPLTMPTLVDEPASETFIDQYREWAKDATDAIPEFHDLCCAIMLSSVVANSVRLATSYGTMVPNLWGLVLGDSTLSRKTTAMAMAMDMLSIVDNDVILATDGTPEGLLSGLSTRPNKTSIFFKDEVSGFFDSINRKDYLAGMAETLTQLYDVPSVYRRRLRKEVITIESAAFVFFGGGVRGRVYDALSDEYVLSGFLPRFLVVSGDADISKLRRTTRPTSTDVGRRSALVAKLADLYENYAAEVLITVLGQKTHMPPRITADLTDEAWNTYGDIEMKMVQYASESMVRDLALPTFERMSRSLLKLAVILAATRQEPNTTGENTTILVEKNDVVNAAWYIQDWGRYSVDLILNTGKRSGERMLEKVLSIIRSKPGILKSQIMQHHHFTKREADEVLTTLEERQQIKKEQAGRGYRYFPE